MIHTTNPYPIDVGPFRIALPSIVQTRQAMCWCGAIHTPTSAPCLWWGRPHPKDGTDG